MGASHNYYVDLLRGVENSISEFPFVIKVKFHNQPNVLPGGTFQLTDIFEGEKLEEFAVPCNGSDRIWLNNPRGGIWSTLQDSMRDKGVARFTPKMIDKIFS